MARNLTVAATALLFLFNFAYARSPLDLPEIDVARNDDSLVDLTESDPKSTPTIILPSEKPESEPLKVAELESEETETIESKIPTATEKPEPNSDNDFVMPLTVVTFRPINRHFPRRPLIPFRRGHRCHGRHHHHNNNNFKPWGPQEVSYGNDMILSGGKDLDFDPVSRGGDREMPARWTRFNHGGHRFSLINDESRTEEMNDKPHHHHHIHFRHHHDHEEEVEEKRHDHDHDHDHDHEEEVEEKRHDHDHDHDHEEEVEEKRHDHDHHHDHDHDHDHGFMKGIRKFLNHF